MTDREKLIEELRALMFEKSNSANVEPVFTDENGEEHYLPDGAIMVLNDILEKAFIPFLAEVLYDNNYRKIIPNVDFVVRASDLVKIREKAIQDILQELFDMAKEQGKHPVQTPVNWIDNVNALAKKHSVKVK